MASETTAANPALLQSQVANILIQPLSGMMFALIDVVDPYKGLYNISSKNMHYALEAMLTDNAVKGLAHSSDAAGEESSDLPTVRRERPEPVPVGISSRDETDVLNHGSDQSG